MIRVKGTGGPGKRGAAGAVPSEELTSVVSNPVSVSDILRQNDPQTSTSMQMIEASCRMADSDSVGLGCGLRFFLCL